MATKHVSERRVDWDLLTESGPSGVIKATRIDTLDKGDEFCLVGLMTRFREFDFKEFSAMVPNGITPVNHLMNIVNETELCWSLSVDGKWHGIGGVHWAGDNGCPWLLLSDTLPSEHRHAFRRITRRINDIFFEHFAPLANYVHASSPSHRWLEWLGYTLHPDEVFLSRDEPFILFTHE